MFQQHSERCQCYEAGQCDNGLEMLLTDPPFSIACSTLLHNLLSLATFSPFCQFKVRCGSHGDVIQPTAGPSLNIRHSKTQRRPPGTRDHQRPARQLSVFTIVFTSQIIALMFGLKHLNHHQTNASNGNL